MGNSILEKLSKSKTFIMGIAILWVVAYHSHVTGLPLFIKFPFFQIGYGGVDLFILLSGFGIYYSLSKTDGKDLISFYQRRLIRCASFFPVVILFLFLSKQVAFPHVVGYFTTQNYWIDYMQTDSYRRFWYIAAIFFFYFISPILFQIINEIGKSFKKVLIFKSKNTICFYNSFVFSFDCIVFAC